MWNRRYSFPVKVNAKHLLQVQRSVIRSKFTIPQFREKEIAIPYN